MESGDEIHPDNHIKNKKNNGRSSSTRSNRPRITASYRNYPGWDFIEETLLEEDLDCYDSRADFVDSLMGFFEDYRGVLEDDGVDFDEIERRVNEFWDDRLEE